MPVNYRGIYVHIPFCRQKCFYCDFFSQAGLPAEWTEKYVDALCAEISAGASCAFLPASIYFGGGTPSLLSVGQIGGIVASLKERGWWRGEQERTIEANPGTVDAENLAGLAALGFNRMSFGVQSFSDKLLKNIGRIHTAADGAEAVRLAQLAGFGNINVDLMYGLPGQTLADFKDSVRKAAAIGVQHISAYSLIVEEGTPLADMLDKGLLELPGSQEEEAMYDWLQSYLPADGYCRYEVSNHALPGFKSLHNLQYWQYLPYKGFGAAACSFDGFVRHTNCEDIAAYIGRTGDGGDEKLDEATAMAEFMFMGLRMTEGIAPEDFYLFFNKDIYQAFGKQLKEHEQAGHIKLTGKIKLTPAGMKIGNKIFLTFLP